MSKNTKWGGPQSLINQAIRNIWAGILESNKTAPKPNNDFQLRGRIVHKSLVDAGHLPRDKKEKSTIDYLRRSIVRPEFADVFPDVSPLMCLNLPYRESFG